MAIQATKLSAPMVTNALSEPMIPTTESALRGCEGSSIPVPEREAMVDRCLKRLRANPGIVA